MVNFLFWFVIAILLLSFPFFISGEGHFSLDKKEAFAQIKIFGIKILKVNLGIDENGKLFIIVNKRLRRKSIYRAQNSSKKRIKVNIRAVHIKELSIKIHNGIEVMATTYSCTILSAFFEGVIKYLQQENVLDYASIQVLPCYVNEQTMVSFSTKVYTSFVMFLTALAHTEKGEKYAK